MAQSFRPGEAVIWWKGAGGGYVVPVTATVVAVTSKRVTIAADDPDEKGEGVVTRHVSPASLQRRGEGEGQSERPRERVGPRAEMLPAPADSFEARYPHIASWVQDGWIEIGRDDCDRSFLRAMDIGGVVWEGNEKYASLDEALRALDEGIAEWLEENG